ncbi:hypothetical protein STPH1_6979 [Streptomyces sp. OM5714]|nr:hypothetical protein STPH1_6979 [Streptomyces sp. OM5714]
MLRVDPTGQMFPHRRDGSLTGGLTSTR